MNLLLLLAVLPGVMLIHHVYQLDKIEQEPKSLIMKLVIGGAVMCIPACILEVLIGYALEALAPEGTMPGDLLANFFGVALIEEGVKYFTLKKNTWKNPEFNYRFDGIVYAVAASMGFAILENIFYVTNDWDLGTAVMRAVLSIPGHGVFGIFMGYYYGAARQYLNQDRIGECKNSLRMAVIIPMLLHGFYDFCLSRNESIWLGVFLVFVAVVYFTTYKNLKRYAAEDEPI